MKFNQHGLNKLSWLNGFKVHKNQVTKMTSSQLNEAFGSQLLEGYRGGDPNNAKLKKLFPTFGAEEIPGMEVEQYIKTVREFLQMAERCDWDGLARIETFPDILEDALKSIYETTREDGNEYYDPNHHDAETEEGFTHLLAAIFVEWVDDKAPAQALAERIKGFYWKNQQDSGTVMHPRKFKLRLKQLWKVVDDLPRPGQWPEPTPLEKAQAVWAGLTEDAKLYIKDTKDTDPWDIENGGANTLSYENILDLLVPFWNERYKKLKEAYEKKTTSNKRIRSDDVEEEDDRKSKSTHHCTDDEEDEGGNSSDEEINIEDDDEDVHSRNDDNNNRGGHESRGLDNSNQEQPQQQQQFYSQGFHLHPHPGILYYAGPPVVQQPSAAAASAPAYFAAPPAGQLAPVLATGASAPTAATGASAPTAAQHIQAQLPTYRKVTDANGNIYFIRI